MAASTFRNHSKGFVKLWLFQISKEVSKVLELSIVSTMARAMTRAESILGDSFVKIVSSLWRRTLALELIKAAKRG